MAMNDTTKYVLGLDLGQTQDPTALVIIERLLVREGADNLEWHKRFKSYYHVRELRRYALGTRYTTIADDVHALLQRDPLKENAVLVVDASGVGRSVMDTLRERLNGVLYPHGITIVGGNQVTDNGNSIRVPKRDLVGIVLTLLERDALKIAGELPEAKTLVNELRDFRIKTTKSANDIYEAREGQHDDIVLATALACWWGENREPPAPPNPDAVTYDIEMTRLFDALEREM